MRVKPAGNEEVNKLPIGGGVRRGSNLKQMMEFRGWSQKKVKPLNLL